MLGLPPQFRLCRPYTLIENALERHPDGRLISVSSTRFLLTRGGLHLAADHPYRVVAVYNNPTEATIPDGAMAFLVGPFIPDDAARWPAIDPANALFQADLGVMLGNDPHAAHRQGGRD